MAACAPRQPRLLLPIQGRPRQPSTPESKLVVFRRTSLFPVPPQPRARSCTRTPAVNHRTALCAALGCCAAAEDAKRQCGGRKTCIQCLVLLRPHSHARRAGSVRGALSPTLHPVPACLLYDYLLSPCSHRNTGPCATHEHTQAGPSWRGAGTAV